MTFSTAHRSWGKRLLGAMLVFGLVAGIACGQTASDNSQQIVKEYFDAARAADWKACGQTVHPLELGKFKGTIAPLLTNIKDAGNPADPLLPFFEGATDWDGIIAKDSLQFYASTMNWITSLAPQISMMIAGAEVQFVGSVDEGKELRHHVFHMKLQATDAESSTDVVSVRKAGDKWMVVMGGTINQLAGLFQRR